MAEGVKIPFEHLFGDLSQHGMSVQGRCAVFSAFRDDIDPENPQQTKDPPRYTIIDVADRLRGVDSMALVINADVAQDSDIPSSITSTTLLTSNQ